MAPKKDAKKKDDEPKKVVIPANPAADRELYWAVRQRKSILVIKNLATIKNANPNAQNPITRWTPLHRAVAAGFAELVECLLKLGANPNWKDEPKLPGEEANLDPKAKAKAKAKAAPKKDDKKQAAVREERPPPRPLEPIAEGGTALHLAVEGGILHILALILSADKLEPNIPDKKGRTPLMVACAEGKLISVRRLMTHEKIDPMVKDPLGRTAFLLAASRGHDKVCRLLVDKYGPNLLDATDKENRGAVEYAMGLGTMNPGMMYPRVLDFVRGHKPAALDGKDITHLSSLIGGVTVLRGLGNSVKGDPLEAGTKLVNAGTHFNNEAIQAKETALMKACRGVLTNDTDRAEHQLQVAQMLVKMADPKMLHAKNASAQTMLHIACGALPVPKKKEEKHEEAFKHTHRIGTDRSGMEEMNKMLMRGKEDEAPAEEEKDPVGMTRDSQRIAHEARGLRRFSLAATEARERLHQQMVQMLVDAGVPKDQKDDRGMTPFDYAKWYGDVGCCRVFDKGYGVTLQVPGGGPGYPPRAQTPDLPSRAQTPDSFRPDTPDMLSEMSTRPSTPGIGLTMGVSSTSQKKLGLGGVPEQEEEL